MTKHKHCDCINYENIDVTKGMCLLDEELVPFDTAACSRFHQKPKCKCCNYFSQGSEEGIGNCTGLFDSSHWISGEMTALTCEGYSERV